MLADVLRNATRDKAIGIYWQKHVYVGYCGPARHVKAPDYQMPEGSWGRIPEPRPCDVIASYLSSSTQACYGQ